MSSSQRSESSDIPPVPPQRPTLYFNKVPSIKILVPPKGRYSPQPDERCIMFCSQSVRGRLDQAEPWCRSFCIRRVFDHEVRRTLATQGHNPELASQVVNTNAKFPLPPEGQPAPETQHTPPQSSDGHQWDEEFQWSPSVSHNGSGLQNPRYWKSGWYFWYSKSRWAAQEKMDLMMCDLAKQAEWQKYKEKMNAEWAEQEQKAHAIGELAAEDVGTQTKHAAIQPPIQAPSPTQGSIAAAVEPSVLPQTGPPFPDVASDSILLPIPPPLTAIEVPLRNLFAPSIRLLSITHETLVSGQQKKLVQKLWETTYTAEPWKLARNAVQKVWQAVKENAESENDTKQDRNS